MKMVRSSVAGTQKDCDHLDVSGTPYLLRTTTCVW